MNLEDIIKALDENPQLAEAVSERLLTTGGIIQALDRNPQQMDALRERLLPREIVGLPATVDRFVESTRLRLEKLEQMDDRHSEQIAALTERVDGLAKQTASLAEQVAALTEQVAALAHRVDLLIHRIDRLTHDFGRFRGAYAESAARKRAPSITRALREAKGFYLRYRGELDRKELLAMVDSVGDTSDIPDSVLESFFESDVIIRTADSRGETCYIAVEASYTCDTRDTTRAMGHARLLERFTGKTAYPVVAGVRKDDEISGIVDSGDVFWCQMDDEQIHP